MADLIVTIKQGPIKGILGTDLDGGEFYKFVSIPYAKPPVGSLRFKAPETPESWHEVLDCTSEERDKGCLCFDHVSKRCLGTEDCLYLNVFTKELPKPGSNPKPVMVFIHGGGFVLGSASMVGPEHLLTEDIVLVTFSYRTGIFGFLSSDDTSLDVPGNAGLKDQRFALQWVQENISKFNGDASNVTIFGISAGGASVSYQVLSASSKGLFHKAIAQSGSALNAWTWGQKNVIQVAEKLGKKVLSEKEALDILRDAPAEELLRAAVKIPDPLLNASKRRPFGPVIEKPNPTAFLTEEPYDLYKSGKYNQVPMIQGMTTNEGILYECGNLGPMGTVTPEYGIFWFLGLNEDKTKFTEIEKSIKDFYFKDGITKDAIYKLVSDISFLHGTVESTKLISKTSAHPVYLYIYSREVAISNLIKVMFGLGGDNVAGVAHGGDQTVLFSSPSIKLLGMNFDMDEESRDAVNQLVKIWTDFARTGNPHKDWEPVTSTKNVKYFDIDKNLSLKTNPFGDRFEFWDKIFKDAPKINARLYEKPEA